MQSILQDSLFLHFHIHLKENLGMIKFLKLAANFIATINFSFLLKSNPKSYSLNQTLVKKTILGFYLASYILSKVKLVIFVKYQNKERTSLTGINFV